MLRLRVYLIIILLLSAVISCSSPGQSVASPTPVIPSQPAPITLPPPTNTLPAPSATLSLADTLSPAPPTLTAVPPVHSKTPTNPPKTTLLKIFLIAINDNGVSGKMIGCGDSAVPVNVEVPYTQGVLRAALDRLLSIKDQNYGQSGLYNALYQSRLEAGDITIQDGEAIIHLSGRLTLGGVCDNPRAQAELEETALQFSTVKKVSIFVNGVALKNLLSEK